uniref:transglutaminase-like cysteine peptidase n=1 Tax=Cellvibrio fontiphilus TaxID=1815559 RepID=UPI002B4C1686|nr:transglutaminase-like cysteine peptidase [Cellvibrio fontiphilus]
MALIAEQPSSFLSGSRRWFDRVIGCWLLFFTLFTAAFFVAAERQSQKMQQVMHSRYGEDGAGLLRAWNQMLDTSQTLDDVQKITRVNDFFNRHIRYSDDVTLWQKSDYWATPLETMGMRAGDCEDFTIAKYLSLLELGFANDQLRLIYVRAQIGGQQSKRFQAHMVLGYYQSPTAEPLILDNLIGRIEPASKRPDLRPVFSFNSEGLWVGNSVQSQADPTARLSRWRDLLARIREQGF